MTVLTFYPFDYRVYSLKMKLYIIKKGGEKDKAALCTCVRTCNSA